MTYQSHSAARAFQKSSHRILQPVPALARECFGMSDAEWTDHPDDHKTTLLAMAKSLKAGGKCPLPVYRQRGMHGLGATIHTYPQPLTASPVTGLGAALGSEEGTFMAVGAATVVFVAGLGLLAGRAMAPRESDKLGYSIAGAALAFFGPLGLGALGLVSLATRK